MEGLAALPVTAAGLSQYVASVGIPLLDLQPDAISLLRNLLVDQKDTIQRFIEATDYFILIVFVDNNSVVHISVDVATFSTLSFRKGFALAKVTNGVLEEGIPLPDQLQVISLSSSGDSTERKRQLLHQLRQCTRFFNPLVRVILQADDEGIVKSEADHTFILLKRLRELDIALEQSDMGTLIPQVSLHLHPLVLDAAVRAIGTDFKVHLEKYNSTQVDALFGTLGLDILVSTSQEQREEFANDVNRFAKQWPQELTQQLRLIESPFPGSAEKEIKFWLDFEKKILHTKKHLDSPGVVLTKLILRRTNRVSEQLIKEAESEVERCAEVIHSSVLYLKDFPIDDVEAATELHPKLSKTVVACLQHFAKIKHSRYDFNRVISMLEVLGASVQARLVALLKEKKLLQCPFDDLRRVKRHADEVFRAWDTHLAALRVTLAGVARRRNEKLRPLNVELDSIKERVIQIFQFREQHERMHDTLAAVLAGDESTLIADLNEGLRFVLQVDGDVLDTTAPAGGAWKSAVQLYERHLERVDSKITYLLEGRLSQAHSAEEMFSVFATFNPLFFRGAIRNAVNSFRTTLVKSVREDVRLLQEKFKMRYDDCSERTTADLRDIPPMSGRIVWARQIESQLSLLMKRMEDVLGGGWEDHFEGKQLKEVCSELRGYLDTSELYNNWLSSQLTKTDLGRYATKDLIFLVERDPRSGVKSLRINFDEKQVEVFKEVRYLEWLLPAMNTTHKHIPDTIKSRAAESFARYPTAMALQASLTAFSQAKKGVTDENASLLATHLRAVRECIQDAVGGTGGGASKLRSNRWVKWESPDLIEWVSQFASKVQNFEERVNDLADKLAVIDKNMLELQSCSYNTNVFVATINEVQNVVDDMQTRGYSNLVIWLKRLDIKLENILVVRLRRALIDWSLSFFNGTNPHSATASTTAGSLGGGEGFSDFEHELKRLLPSVVSTVAVAGDGETLLFKRTVHEVILSNQELYLLPPLELSRIGWMNAMHDFISVITNLPRIVSSRFSVFARATEEESKDYSSILQKIEPSLLRLPVLAIEEKFHAAAEYAQQWLCYQTLWDASVADVVGRLGSDVKLWRQLLVEIKAARLTIDSREDEHNFGPLVISHAQVQSKVNIKYDSWQRDCQQRFGSILFEATKNVHQDLIGHKTRLETVYLEGHTKDVIAGVELLLKVKNSLPHLKTLVEEIVESEKLLQKQRFQFPHEWLACSNIMGALSDVSQVFERKSQLMDALLPSLQKQVNDENATVNARIDELISQWEAARPVDGSLVPSEVLQVISMLAAQATKLADDIVRVGGAKAALGLDNVSDARLPFVRQEMSDFKDAWSAVVPAHERLSALRAVLLKDSNPITVRKQLDEISGDLRQLPSKLRSYAAVEYIHDKVAKYLSLQPVMRDLCSEALKDRHWRALLAGMKVTSQTHSTFALGHFWDCGPLTHRAKIQDVLSNAQGELALEQYLTSLKAHWSESELNLILRDGMRLVAGWDVLFLTLEDNVNALASLKQSPYFRNVPEFSESTNLWETRLTALRGILTPWMDVQRKWLYLRGIFKNPDIKAQLPSPFSKFKSLDNEFQTIMKRVSARPQLLELLQIDNLARQLERQDAAMTSIQKALGEYLEKQRLIFPRFYFVNNDDLVEIVGNSGEPVKIMPHLGKMFASLTSLELKDDELIAPDAPTPQALAMISKEGENVPLDSSISLAVAVKDWLGALEKQMVSTLAALVDHAQKQRDSRSGKALLEWMSSYPVQVMILTHQIEWTSGSEDALSASADESKDRLLSLLQKLEKQLQWLSASVLEDLSAAMRKKCEHLLTELVHQRDVTRDLITKKVRSKIDFAWLYQLRYYWQPAELQTSKRLSVRISNASFSYGYEYQGVCERLVQTPLTDRCYLTLAQALHLRLGGNPFGPAGTGKTESVKMLGSNLGRFVVVFNCDSSFDYSAMARILSGLCQVGAWGCMDEFNRLDERILSAVSQSILTIQRGLQQRQDQIELLGNPCKLHSEVGIFVTMNPGYAGRSNLPDNLKQLFRSVAMVLPDSKLIAQVMLFSQGIMTAEDLSGKVVLLFSLLQEQLSAQSHYDFGLRALKSVLVGAGDLKRKALLALFNETNNGLDKAGDGSSSIQLEMSDDVVKAQRNFLVKVETEVTIRACCDTILPKLVPADIPIFRSVLESSFPGSAVPTFESEQLSGAITKACSDELVEGQGWVDKIFQLRQVLEMRHGVILVGPSGTGKTAAWRTLQRAMTSLDGIKCDAYTIDPKSITKEQLFGRLDPNTLEWTDGVFTRILRKVNEATSRGVRRRTWIVLDGDIDPEWAENLNSVLDDNKVLTLPSGDRLKIPPNLHIIIEVDSLQHATLATVSRCGMVWFSADTVNQEMLLMQGLKSLRGASIVLTSDSIIGVDSSSLSTSSTSVQKETQKKFIDAISSQFAPAPGIVGVALDFALSQKHVMGVSIHSLLESLSPLLIQGISAAVEYNENNAVLPMSDSHMEQFAGQWLLYAIYWAFGASLLSEKRIAFASLVADHSTHAMNLPAKARLGDVYVDVSSGEWAAWSNLVPAIEIEAHRVSDTDVVIATTDTLRHMQVVKAWLMSHKPLILIGPPGSGKTMTLTNVLESVPDLIFAGLNLSSTSTPRLILKTLYQFCEIVDSPDGLVMQPNHRSYRERQWLVVFCDEINLPSKDAYGTQRIIMFLRQLIESNGFWSDNGKWIMLRRVQFVGACNPPTDVGRVVLPPRFLRHAPLLYVDYPSVVSLRQIYGTFNHALLKLHPNLRSHSDALTAAMLEVYQRNQAKFTSDLAPQYIYSPRELSRWVRAMYEAMEPLEALTIEELVRLWAHEALRLFHDRLVSTEERLWCEHQIDAVAEATFPKIDIDRALRRPMLYTKWIKRNYVSVETAELKAFVAARLKVFYEEELDVPLVVFDEVLDHVLRIDNVLRSPMGHLLLVGESGVGKTVLSRFVSWMNGLSVFQVKANNRYTLELFDEDLRSLLKRTGVDGEKICFIFDEGNVLSSAFLERMNSLLASGEVPGLFGNDDRAQLLSSFRDNKRTEHAGGKADDELWREFTKCVQRNLHVIFTINPASADFENRCTASPALFNRCVVDWFGTWGRSALAQVAREFTACLDTGFTSYEAPTLKQSEQLYSIAALLTNSSQGEEQASSGNKGELRPNLHQAVVTALVMIHDGVKESLLSTHRLGGRQHYLSPRDFLDLIRKFMKLENEKRSLLEERQSHLGTGLSKLNETRAQVAVLREAMMTKETALKAKDSEANAKLALMVEKQNDAERSKAIAEKLSAELNKRNEEIRVRKDTVEQELAEAEPAILAAKQSVQGIKKTQLDEVRALVRPPNAVRMTMEMVCIMIGEKNMEWNEIRKIIRSDLIATTLNFDTDTLTPKQIRHIQDDYLKNPELDYVSVDRASKACGPLYQWVASQITYAAILGKVRPLREELIELEQQCIDLQGRADEALTLLDDLEVAIKQYKAEYATTIREMETIRTEKEAVATKVSRAESLLISLEQERLRWQETSASFETQMATLIGDCLLSAAFLTYAGIFDHRGRKVTMVEWLDVLDQLRIPSTPDGVDVTSYLCSPSDLLRWKEYGLPSDDLAIQNAILLDRFDRYPLIIDPAGQALSFLNHKYAERKLTLTSFLDNNFLKTLISAIRFGTPLLVQDVENIDPILNPVLNRELQKTGGRTLIRLGNEDIDFSPKFLIILATRNALAAFPPDLCSRVTLINFSITSASLESQSLSAVLRAERPEVDARRSQLLALQSKQSAKLRDLEETLLDKISALQGAILDDDSVIRTLEVIKREAAELSNEVCMTQKVIDELKAVAGLYEPLAKAITLVFFSIERLAEVDSLYQFSLEFFLGIVSKVLDRRIPLASSVSNTISATGSKLDIKEVVIRVKSLAFTFFNEVSRRVVRGLRHDHKLVFMARLAQIASTAGFLSPAAAASKDEQNLTDAEYNFLYNGGGGIINDSKKGGTVSSAIAKFKTSLPATISVDSECLHNLFELSLVPSFSSLSVALASPAHLSMWTNFFMSSEPEKSLTLDWLLPFSSATSTQSPQQTTGSVRAVLLNMLLIRACRPDRMPFALQDYVSAVFSTGEGLDWRSHHKFDIRRIIEEDSTSTRPLLLCSEAGHDVSQNIDSLAQIAKKCLLQVSMGSTEGLIEADKSIAQAVKTGAWVLLRNVHLCVSWLSALEKKLPSLTPHLEFRLFLTCEISPHLPAALLRACDIVVAEASAGVKSAIQRLFSSIPDARIERAPAERSRLYEMLASFHAIVLERLKYTPLGWTKKYEFSEADALVALDVIDEWVDTAASSSTSSLTPSRLRANVDPAELPWMALRLLLSRSIYGGRIDNPFDQAVLDTLIGSIFCADNYSTNAVLITDPCGKSLLSLPDTLSRSAFESWLKTLPDESVPTLLGLSSVAETHLRRNKGLAALLSLSTLQGDASGAVRNSSVISSAPLRNFSSSLHFSFKSLGVDLQRIRAEISSLLDLLPLPNICDEGLGDKFYGGDIKVKEKTTAETSGLPVVAGPFAPLIRFLEREVLQARTCLSVLRHSLTLARALCDGGEESPSDDAIEIIAAIAVGSGHPNIKRIPSSWTKYLRLDTRNDRNTKAVHLLDFITEMLEKITFTEKYHVLLNCKTPAEVDAKLRTCIFQLGQMFSPNVFLTATRQYSSQANGSPMEDLVLLLEPRTLTSPPSSHNIFVEGLHVEGAEWAEPTSSGIGLQLTENTTRPLQTCSLLWIVDEGDLGKRSGYQRFPLYSDSSRSSLLSESLVPVAPVVATADVVSPPEKEHCMSDEKLSSIWLLRSVAMIIQ